MQWNNELAIDRYYIDDNEGHEGLATRVGTFVANGDKQWVDPFTKAILDMKFIPGGRILRNAGRPKGGLINCYARQIPDHIEGIAQVVAECMILNAEGGGVGLDASLLRPKGDPIKGKGGSASGPLSWLKIINTSSGVIETGGQRRAALLALLSVRHPDIEKFIDAKTQGRILSNFNISVGITKSFIKAVEEDDEWDLVFRDKVYSKVRAKILWDKIVENMLVCAEPGIINLSNLYKNNSFLVGEPVVCTNPCGELPLDDGGACCLGSFVLPAFVKDHQMDWKDLDSYVEIGIRFLDSVLDVNQWTLQINRDKAQGLRRIGLGTMGLADMLFLLGIRYGSPSCIEFLDILYSRIRNTAYRVSVEIAKEKGSFPKYQRMFLDAKFIRTLPRSIYGKIKESGIRNVTMLTCPPNGTTSLLVDVSSGVEPLFAKAYERSDRYNKKVQIVHPLTEAGCTEDWFVDSSDITPAEHLEVQAAIQRYVDGAVSKTINVPESCTVDDLSADLFSYLPDLKGVTVYRQGSRENQVLTPMTCKSGVCDV